MSKSNTRAVLGFAFAVASGAFIFAGPASAQTGAYTDSSPNVRASLQREHFFILGHTDAVRKPSAAARRSGAAQRAESSYAYDAPYSDAPYVVSPADKDFSIRSQR
jgi:hypothetical protein